MDFGEAQLDPRASAWISRRWQRIRRVVSICSGAFVLADAGVLAGRRVTTHWRELERLGQVVPDATVESDALYVKDGSVYTSAGITAGIDLALALVEEDLGPDLALEVARILVMFLHRPGGQSQFSAALRRPVAEHPGIRDVQTDVTENPGKDHRVPELARRAGMSTRHFVRVFTQETGEPPAHYVQRVRLERARQLLEREGLSVEEVATICGFGSAETMRRRFQHSLGVSPSEYRARFRRPVSA
jgi:transcriptional regulator GlxA family with amidase domain